MPEPLPRTEPVEQGRTGSGFRDTAILVLVVLFLLAIAVIWAIYLV